MANIQISGLTHKPTAFATTDQLAIDTIAAITYKITGSDILTFVNTNFNSISPLTTKGDILAYSTTSTRFPGGTVNGQVMTWDSTQPFGMKWALPATSGTVTSITAGTNLTGGTITTSGTIALSATPSGLTSLGVGNLSLISNSITSSALFDLIAALNTDLSLKTSGTGAIAIKDSASATAIPLRFYNSAGTFYSGFKAGTLSVSNTWILPATDSTGTQALVSNGSNVLSWASFGSGTVTSVSGTSNRITSTGGATPVIDIDPGYVGQASITTLGSITTGTWNATTISPSHGGTGINNGSNTLTLAGALSTVGAFSSTFTMTNTTSVTFPTSGTLATTAGTVASVSGTSGRISSTGGNNPVIDLVNTAVTPGSYTAANITVDASGRITAASNGHDGDGEWTIVTDTSVTMVSNNKYLGNNPGMLSTTFALPTTTITTGDSIQVAVPPINDPNFVAQQDGQTISIGGQITTPGTGHGITTSSVGAVVLLVAISSTDFMAYPMIGAWDVY